MTGTEGFDDCSVVGDVAERGGGSAHDLGRGLSRAGLRSRSGAEGCGGFGRDVGMPRRSLGKVIRRHFDAGHRCRHAKPTERF